MRNCTYLCAQLLDMWSCELNNRIEIWGGIEDVDVQNPSYIDSVVLSDNPRKLYLVEVSGTFFH